MDDIGGVTLDMLAEITTKQGTLGSQFGSGSAKSREEFLAYLATLGLTESSFSQAHNAWLMRMRSDPTGQLEADYHMRVSRLSSKAHFGDVRDMSGDVEEGVTLDHYARLCVAMAKPGIDADAVARFHGLADAAHWMRVNAAWTAALGRDTSMKLTSQFGELYSKHAGPELERSMRDQTAAILAGSRSQPEEPYVAPREETVDELIAKLSAPVLKDRFQAARWLAHRWDLGHAADPSLDRALVCIPVLVEALERHGEDEAGMAEDAAGKLIDLGQTNDDVRGSMQRCLNRAAEQLATMHRAFAPIADKAVPERIFLRAKIDAHESLVKALHRILDEWPSAARVSAPSSPGVGARAPRKSGSSVPIVPVVLVVIAAAAGGAYFLRGGSNATPSPTAAPAKAEAPAATTAAIVPATTPPKAQAASPASPAKTGAEPKAPPGGAGALAVPAAAGAKKPKAK